MIHEISLIAAFTMGLLGSVHCVGMCGGIVGTLNAGHARHRPAIWLSYNFGRVLSYAAAGAVAGVLGETALSVFAAERAQSVGLMISGGFMIALGLYLAGWWRGLVALEQYGARLWRHIQPLAHRLLPITSPGRAVVVGVVWGWLPCGLVYSMLAWSLAAGHAAYGASLMTAFGLGTLPMLYGLSTATQRVQRWRQNSTTQTVLGTLIALFGVLTFLGVVHPIHFHAT